MTRAWRALVRPNNNKKEVNTVYKLRRKDGIFDTLRRHYFYILGLFVSHAPICFY